MAVKLKSVEGFVSSFNVTTRCGFIRPHNPQDSRFFPFHENDFGGQNFRAHFRVSSSGAQERGGSSDVRFYLVGNKIAFIDEVLRY